uniref:long-chain-fatty-acid--CoA ligase n=1 Tax=Sphenodon punctatus TaxID=8508 RepID=A0A8D0GMM6_SPHPU
MHVLYTALVGLLLLLPLLGGVLFPYWWQDVAMFFATVRMGFTCERCLRRSPPFMFLDAFLDKARRHPGKALILFGDEVHSYQDVDRRSSQVARALQERAGLKEGDAVAVFLMNVPAYLWVWLGLAKLGCAMACLNYNIRDKSLLHSLSSCGAKVLLTMPDLRAATEDVLPSLQKEGIQVFYISDESPTEGVEPLLRTIKSCSEEPVPRSFRANVTYKSTALYIYTSGTTGEEVGESCHLGETRYLHCRPDVDQYSLYCQGELGCLSATCVLKPKFSVSQFWNDCRKYRVSVIQYVGEVMRYLCNVPEKENDRDHGVRLALGNGMRVEVWKDFLRRFGPIQVYEFYGATEGNAGFINYTGKIGAVGRVNFLLKLVAPFELIRYDVDQDEPMRDEQGRCIRVSLGKAGLLVVKITDNAPFNGYAGDGQKSEKKILRDVLKKGDRYFNSGDLLMMDREGFIYFQDRVGDTFRWKGENVATTEVETVLAAVEFVQEVNVYGVPVPGHEGKIGMATVRLKEGSSFDGGKLYKHVKDYLPGYATPRFVRIQETLEITSTFKQCKGQLTKEGFDCATIRDPLFFLDETEKCYVPMNQQIYSSILEMRLKL